MQASTDNRLFWKEKKNRRRKSKKKKRKGTLLPVLNMSYISYVDVLTLPLKMDQQSCCELCFRTSDFVIPRMPSSSLPAKFLARVLSRFQSWEDSSSSTAATEHPKSGAKGKIEKKSSEKAFGTKQETAV